MKIAFVSQPIDTVLPPYQNSVGACTYGVARPMSLSASVIVYALQDNQTDGVLDLPHGADFTFRALPSTRSDRLAHRLRRTYSKVFTCSTPISVSNRLFPDFGKQVAIDLQKQNCDVIHIQHCSQYAQVIRAFNPTAKIVLHLHAEWFSQCRPALLEQRLRSVDLLTTVSDHITKKTRRDFPAMADRCETAYNGFDSNEFRRLKTYPSGPGREMKRILYSGAISPHKGVHILLEAFGIVAKQYPNVHLDIVGSLGNYPLEETFDLRDRDSIKLVAPFYAKNRLSLLKSKLKLAPPGAKTYQQWLKEKSQGPLNGRVAFYGFIPRPQLIDLYYAADVFAFPPVWDEGFGLPPVEAMAAGAPVVASRSGALVETVVDGQTGWLVEKNDVAGLAEALLALLRDDSLREKVGRAARERAFQMFTWEAASRRMLARYRQLCGASGESTEEPVAVGSEVR